MNFIEKLDYMMERKGLSKSKLSQISGVPYTTIDGFYKKGYENIKLSTARKLSKALEVTLDYLLDDNVDDENDAFDSPFMKKAPLYSSEAMRMAKDYDRLDSWGRQAVRELADTELARMEDNRRFLEDSNMEEEPKVINLFDNPSAAGPAMGETGQGCRLYELAPEDPQGAAYAVRVQGNSMEPYFPDGSIAFVNHDQMRDGDIGIFCVDGATVIKQWHYDPVLGITYLFSLNRKRDDADVVITRNSGRSCVWQGRVITRQRFRLPGM